MCFLCVDMYIYIHIYIYIYIYIYTDNRCFVTGPAEGALGKPGGALEAAGSAKKAPEATKQISADSPAGKKPESRSARYKFCYICAYASIYIHRNNETQP